VTARRCNAATLRGRPCRRANPQYVVAGDPYDDRFCRQHVTRVAARPGASGYARHLTSGGVLPVDPAGRLLPRNLTGLVDVFAAVRCHDGYERGRRAVLAALDDPASGVKTARGLHPDLHAAMSHARHRLARIAATQQPGGVRSA
jgi:hypothetical protein